MAKIYATQNPAVTEREIRHLTLSRTLGGECVVLLENDGALPLKPGKAALFGNGACGTVKGGSGSGEVNARESVNIVNGLKAAGFELTTTPWLERQSAHEKAAHEAYGEWVKSFSQERGLSEFYVRFTYHDEVTAPAEITDEDIAASDTDTAIYVIARTSGEGGDRKFGRGDYLLYEEEKAQLKKLAAAYEKLIVVLNIGGVMDMAELKAIEGINAVVLMSQLGNIGGHILADVLTGAVNPSGKLTDTWARRYEDYPASTTFSHNDGEIIDEYYTEGIYVGYRYFDTFGIEPLYPFGYGKSYTTFRLGVPAVKAEDGAVTVCVEVSNTGACAGKEVVQVYVSSPAGHLPKPYQELRAYAKTRLLNPGESETVTLTFKVREMASYCEKCAAWVLEKGDYIVRVGTSSRDTAPAAVLTLPEPVKTEILKNFFKDEKPVKEITAPRRKPEEIGAEIPRIALDPSKIETNKAVYCTERKPYTTDKTEKLTTEDVKSGKCTAEELVAQLTVEEMADLCVGTRRDEGGSVVGDSSQTVPGAAGDTSAVIEETRGVKPLILADGPAGLRLKTVFKTDKEGNMLPGGTLMGSVGEPFDPKYTDENSDTYYQYCTAIPIGWALAQSWNAEILREIGSMVGTEMELFGVDLWLAPALNIHRDPLCGRNYEYFSEDPLVSGKTAAAITEGVQRHPGKGTTIKHFAANNQEDNRYFSNAHVSERALREIYLRGFEIAVRESAPMSIMSSYNLLNGVHTANSIELLQYIARDEWGFDGFVMTDWFTSCYLPFLTGENKTPYPISASTGCIYAGNDVQMPGSRQNYDDIVASVKGEKEIDGYATSLADLQACAANVIRIAIRADV